MNSNGAVKLADFGVSACMFDTGDRQRTRNTFVGTPCWLFSCLLLEISLLCYFVEQINLIYTDLHVSTFFTGWLLK